MAAQEADRRDEAVTIAIPPGPHLGDLPNITVGKDSSVNVQATSPGGTTTCDS
jgi:Cu/Zn superoxide dismutase